MRSVPESGPVLDETAPPSLDTLTTTGMIVLSEDGLTDESLQMMVDDGLLFRQVVYILTEKGTQKAVQNQRERTKKEARVGDRPYGVWEDAVVPYGYSHSYLVSEKDQRSSDDDGSDLV